MSLPPGSASRAGNIIVNPSGSSPGDIETPLRCEAWWMLDLSPVWGFPTYRGENIVLGGQPGERAYEPVLDGTTYVSAIYICGDVDRNASASPSGSIQGLRENLDHLFANVHAPSGATRTTKLIDPNGSTSLAECQFKLALGRTKGPHGWIACDLHIPAGRFP